MDKIREALERIIDHAEDWHAHYCEMWGERRKEQQDAILGDILNARALLALESAEPAEARTVKDYLTVTTDERRPEVEALLWMVERLMGSSAASTMRGWLAEYRATGKLVVRDADGTVKDSLTVAGPAEERGPEVGDVVATIDRQSGEITVHSFPDNYAGPSDDNPNWRLVVLMRRAEVEARIKERQ